MHRDYHFGFFSDEGAAAFPAHVHRAAPSLTLQGAVAHCDMPVETGTRTITLTVRGGLDTDSNGATAGSVAGVLTGADAIPEQWKDPLEDTVRSAVFGFDGVRISELAERTVRLADGE